MSPLELDPRLIFDTFVVGASNRLASAAARRVAESPGSTYNPLFIYSASGLGKTHLVMAIGDAARRTRPEIRVVYHTLTHLMDEVASAIEAGERDVFRAKLTDVDLLLVDDVQFLAGRYQTQEELLRVWDALLARDGQVVLASDRPPQEMEGLDERLLSRFSGGLIMDIEAPDYETRVAIIRRKTENRGQTLGEGVPEALARMAFRNVRELQGALNRIFAVQDLEERQVTPEDVPRLVDELAESLPDVDEFSDFLSDLTGTLSEVGVDPLPQPPSGYAFDRLHLSDELFAVRAAAAVVDEPGGRYNPLYIQGPPESGKTALLATIGNEIRARAPDRPMAYVEGEEFAEELIDALEHNRVDSWRDRYRQAAVLLVDDVDALGETERAQEELFHLFDALYHAGAQLVFTGARPPRELAGIEERLRTRLESGLVVELGPDAEPQTAARAAEPSTAETDTDGRAEPAHELDPGETAAQTPAGDPETDAGDDADAEDSGPERAAGDAQPLAGAGAATGSEAGRAAAAETAPAGTSGAADAGATAADGPDGAGGAQWLRNREKVVWRWPYPEQWLVEELE